MTQQRNNFFCRHQFASPMYRNIQRFAAHRTYPSPPLLRTSIGKLVFEEYCNLLFIALPQGGKIG